MKILKAIEKTRANALVFFIKRLELLPYYLSRFEYRKDNVSDKSVLLS